MSDDTPPTIPPAPATFPMTCQEAYQIGMLEEQQKALNAAISALGAKTCARLGLPGSTILNIDPQRGIYTVGG